MPGKIGALDGLRGTAALIVVVSLSVSVPFTYIDKFAIDVSNRFGTWNLLPEYDPADRLRVPAVVRSSEPRIKGDRRRSVVCNE